jgi:hypothetical protein
MLDDAHREFDEALAKLLSIDFVLGESKVI